MKRRFTLFAVVVVSIMTIGSGAFVSCDKEIDVLSNSNNDHSVTKDNPDNTIYLASCDITLGLSSLIYGFDVDDFEDAVNILLADSVGNEFIFNDITIIDDSVSNLERDPYLAVSIVNTLTGEMETQFGRIDKTISGNEVLYTTDGEGLNIVICSGKNCKNGCMLNEDHTGCTSCENGDGTCSTFSLHISLSGLFDKILDIIKDL